MFNYQFLKHRSGLKYSHKLAFFHFLEAKLEGMERNGLVKSPGENLMDKTTIVLQE